MDLLYILGFYCGHIGFVITGAGAWAEGELGGRSGSGSGGHELAGGR